MTISVSDSTATTVTLLLALACFGSFVWSIVGFFRREHGIHLRMKLISVTGSGCMVVHLCGILTQHSAEPWKVLLAWIAYTAALGIFWWALWATWKCRLALAFCSDTPRNIVREGPYRFLRHPIYSSYLWAWFAGALAINTWWGWLPIAVMGVQYFAAIRLEERQFLESELVAQYAAYMRQTYRVLYGVY